MPISRQRLIFPKILIRLIVHLDFKLGVTVIGVQIFGLRFIFQFLNHFVTIQPLKLSLTFMECFKVFMALTQLDFESNSI